MTKGFAIGHDLLFFDIFADTGSVFPSVGESLRGLLATVTFYLVCLGVKRCGVLLREEHRMWQRILI